MVQVVEEQRRDDHVVAVRQLAIEDVELTELDRGPVSLGALSGEVQSLRTDVDSVQIELQIGSTSFVPQPERQIPRPGRNIEHAQPVDLQLPRQLGDRFPDDARAGTETIQSGQPAQRGEVSLTVERRIIHDFRLADTLGQKAELSQG